jgi:hypothetical protein
MSSAEDDQLALRAAGGRGARAALPPTDPVTTVAATETAKQRGSVCHDRKRHHIRRRDKKGKDKPRARNNANQVLSATRMVASTHACSQMHKGPISMRWKQNFRLFWDEDFVYR